jgi:hypothetical protein
MSDGDQSVFFVICGFQIAAKLSAVDFSFLAFAADNATAHFLSHSFAQLVQQDECGLVGEARITREGERALALHLVTEHGDCRQIAPQGSL